MHCALLTDYGTRDGFVAVCHGVIGRFAPDVPVLDISHDVPRHDARHGSIVLRRVAPYLDPAAFVGVVDPGVGTARRGVALRAGRSYLVGPDNGLLVPAAEALGGIDEAYVLSNPGWWLPSVDRTFHGRDVFAPVGARLAAGAPIAAAGTPVDPDSLVRLPSPVGFLDTTSGTLTAEIVYVDGFGNLQLAGTLGTLHGKFDVRPMFSDAALGTACAAATFGEVPTGELLLYKDSDGSLALAVNGGSAAEFLGVRGGDLLRLVPV